jgi:hypothetical protein
METDAPHVVSQATPEEEKELLGQLSFNDGIYFPRLLKISN